MRCAPVFIALLLAPALLSFSARNPKSAAALTLAQKQEVIQAAWQHVNDLFYDPAFRGVDWRSVREIYLRRAGTVETRPQLESIVRQMFALLHNSHIGVMNHEELAWTRQLLPFFFDQVAGRFFVSYVFERNDGQPVGLRFGDEILSVDGVPASRMRQPSVTWLQPVLDNPYYGPPGSIAELRIRRRGSLLTLKVARVQAFAGVRPLIVSHFGNIAYLRFLKMDANAVSPAMLQASLAQVAGSQALVLDLRHCVGGDATVADPLGGFVLGPDIKLVTRVPRPDAHPAYPVIDRTTDSGTVFRGKVAILVDNVTQSEPEMLTAALVDYDRAIVAGQRTRGALNGFTEAAPLPDGVGIAAIPINRSISPAGKQYEGIGVAPTRPLQNRVPDYLAGRDRVLDAALRMASP
jgi:C-terminal processing protease CtpA/Prc